MPKIFSNSAIRESVAARIDYYRELGIFDFYRREPLVAEEAPPETPGGTGSPAPLPAFQERLAAPDAGYTTHGPAGQALTSLDPASELIQIRAELGDCTRCPLHAQGRKQIVFGVGNPRAELMFVGEAPGADEDQQGEPFVGRAGQLLNNMIAAMGLKREQVYIANIIKCRPPGNRTPLPEECATCSPFLLRQIDAIQPQVLVALGAIAARTLLGVNESMGSLRGKWYQCRGAWLAVTYHPAYLLRNPPAKKDTWQDLQMVMKRMGLEKIVKS